MTINQPKPLQGNVKLTGRADGAKRGPKPGNPHSGQFKQGNDPRRHLLGPRKMSVIKTLEQKCSEHVDDAVAFLVDLMANQEAPISERRQAARELLDRGFGRPVDRLAIAQTKDGLAGGPIPELTTADLTRIASGGMGLRSVAPGAIDGQAQVLETVEDSGPE